MSIFIVGANGTLGFQIALLGKNRKYRVTCLVRRYTRETDMLTYEGARILCGDMMDIEVLLESIFGSNVLIDASTGRLFDPVEVVDYRAKLLLLRVAETLKMDRFVFYSLVNAEAFTSIPLVETKLYLEEAIKKSSVPYTILRLTGFYQGIIKEYAIPMIDDEFVYVANENMPISYIDCIDVARLTLRTFTSQKMVNRTIDVGGLEPWTANQILAVCQECSGIIPVVKRVPILDILITRSIASFFESSWNLTRRLSLIDLIKETNNTLVTDPKELLEIFEIQEAELRKLTPYLYYYFDRVFQTIMQKYTGNPEDDEKELDEWRKKGVQIIDTPIEDESN